MASEGGGRSRGLLRLAIRTEAAAWRQRARKQGEHVELKGARNTGALVFLGFCKSERLCCDSMLQLQS